MKHIVIGYLALLLLPFLPAYSLGRHWRAFVILMLAAAWGQVFIGLCNLGTEGIHISEFAAMCWLAIAGVVCIVGSAWVLRKPRRPRNNI